MDSTLETFFLSNIIYPNDVKRRLNTIRSLDLKIEEKRSQLDLIKTQIKAFRGGSTAEERLLGELDEVYKELKALSQEKYDHACTAFMMYENVLRRTDNMIDELKPEEPTSKEIIQPKSRPVPVGLSNIGKVTLGYYLDNEEEKPVRSGRTRSKHKKKQPTSQKIEGKLDNLYLNETELNPGMQIDQDEEVAWPWGQNIIDDWVGWDMKEKWEYEWFHLKCVKLEQVPNEDLWFCDDCKVKYKKEIEQKYKALQK